MPKPGTGAALIVGVEPDPPPPEVDGLEEVDADAPAVVLLDVVLLDDPHAANTSAATPSPMPTTDALFSLRIPDMKVIARTTNETSARFARF